MQSDKLDQLIPALLKAQSMFPDFIKNKSGYGYNYITLSSVLKDTRNALNSNRLLITQSFNGNKLETSLIHVSGQFLSSSIDLIHDDGKKMNEIQKVGSAITYFRRYSIEAMLGISSIEDTDGVYDHKTGEKKVKTQDSELFKRASGAIQNSKDLAVLKEKWMKISERSSDFSAQEFKMLTELKDEKKKAFEVSSSAIQPGSELEAQYIEAWKQLPDSARVKFWEQHGKYSDLTETKDKKEYIQSIYDEMR